MARDSVKVTAPVDDIAKAYALAAEKDVTLSQLTIEAWKMLLHQSGAIESNQSKATASRTESKFFDGLRVTDMELEGYPSNTAEHTATKILWGQFSRFLPIKYTLRILASIDDHPVPLAIWQDAVREHSFLMREHLRSKDKRHRIPRGSQLSAGFPRGKSKKRDRSMDRFLSHYTAVVQSGGEGPVVGMCAELGFINVQVPEKLVSLSTEGLEYVILDNPQLDGEDSSIESTSDAEKSFLLNHVRANLVEDWSFCTDVMDSISDGWNSSETLFAAMTEKHPNLGDNTLRTNIGGALGRLSDLGTVSRSWQGRSSRFHVTEVGK